MVVNTLNFLNLVSKLARNNPDGCRKIVFNGYKSNNDRRNHGKKAIRFK